MASPAYAIEFSALVSGVTGAGAAGDVLVLNPAGSAYYLSTTANRGSRRSTGVALTPYADGGTVEIQQFGQITPSLVPALGAGTASWVRVSALGQLERCTPAGSDDVCGWVETDGTFHACFGMLTAAVVNGTGGGGGTVPTGTGFTHITAGAQDAAATGLTFTGDTTGTGTAASIALTTVKANGATVPAAGALVTGNVLQVSGVSALSYGPVNLAGGANYVTGSLPAANQAAQTLAGDATGLVSANTVVKVNGTAYPAGGALTTGTVPRVTGVATVAYGALDLANASAVTGTLPAGNQAAQTLAGDVTGTTAASTISGLAVTKLAAGSAGQYLQTVGASPTWVYATQTGGYRTARVVATGNLTLSGTQTIDGTACVAGDRVLAAGQTTQANNGIYIVAAGAWSFAPDWATSLVVSGMRIGITEGTANADSSWLLFTTGAITVGTTAVNFVRDLATPVTPGNVLQVSGSGSAVYGAVNLAGGANYVTGVLPTGNQAAQTMAGDVTGTTAASVVAKINGATVPAAGALTTGHVLQVSGVSANTYGFVANANVAAAAAIAGTKINPDFGSQNVFTTGYMAFGSSVALSGSALRLGASLSAYAKTSGTDRCLWEASDATLYLGNNASNASQFSSINIYGGGTGVNIGGGASAVTYMQIVSDAIQLWKPLQGSASGSVPFCYSVGVLNSTSITTFTASAAQYACPILQHTSSAGSGTVIWNLPNTLGATYIVDNQSAATVITLKVALQTGVTIAVTKKATIYCNGTDYVRVTPDT